MISNRDFVNLGFILSSVSSCTETSHQLNLLDVRTDPGKLGRNDVVPCENAWSNCNTHSETSGCLERISTSDGNMKHTYL